MSRQPTRDVFEEALRWVIAAHGWRYPSIRDQAFADLRRLQAEPRFGDSPAAQLRQDAYWLRDLPAPAGDERTALETWAVAIARITRSAPPVWRALLAPADRTRDLEAPVFLGRRAYGAADAALFFERADDQKRLARALDDPHSPVIVVSGPEGVGKTSLVEVVLGARAAARTVAASARPSRAALLDPELLHLDGLDLRAAADLDFMGRVQSALVARQRAGQQTVISTRCPGLVPAPQVRAVPLEPLTIDARRAAFRQIAARGSADLPPEQLERLIVGTEALGDIQAALLAWRPPAAPEPIEPSEDDLRAAWSTLALDVSGCLLRLLAEQDGALVPRDLPLAVVQALELIAPLAALEERGLVRTTDGQCWRLTPLALATLPAALEPERDDVRALTALAAAQASGRGPDAETRRRLPRLRLLFEERAFLAAQARVRARWRLALVAAGTVAALIIGVLAVKWAAEKQRVVELRADAAEQTLRAHARAEADPVVAQALLASLTPSALRQPIAALTDAHAIGPPPWRLVARWPALGGPVQLTGEGALMADDRSVVRRRVAGAVERTPTLAGRPSALALGADGGLQVATPRGVQRVEAGSAGTPGGPSARRIVRRAGYAWLFTDGPTQRLVEYAGHAVRELASGPQVQEAALLQSQNCLAAFMGKTVWRRCADEPAQRTEGNPGKIMVADLRGDRLAYATPYGQVRVWEGASPTPLVLPPLDGECRNPRLLTLRADRVVLGCPIDATDDVRLMEWTFRDGWSAPVRIATVPLAARVLVDWAGTLVYGDADGRVGLIRSAGRTVPHQLLAERITAMRGLDDTRLAVQGASGEVRVFELAGRRPALPGVIRALARRPAVGRAVALVDGGMDAPQLVEIGENGEIGEATKPAPYPTARYIASSPSGDGLAHLTRKAVWVVRGEQTERFDLSDLPAWQHPVALEWGAALVLVTRAARGPVQRWTLADGVATLRPAPDVPGRLDLLTPGGGWRVEVATEGDRTWLRGAQGERHVFAVRLEAAGVPRVAATEALVFIADGARLRVRHGAGDRTVEWARFESPIQALLVADDTLFVAAGRTVHRWPLKAAEVLQGNDAACLTASEFRAYKAVLTGRSARICPPPEEPPK